MEVLGNISHLMLIWDAVDGFAICFPTIQSYRRLNFRLSWTEFSLHFTIQSKTVAEIKGKSNSIFNILERNEEKKY